MQANSSQVSGSSIIQWHIIRKLTESLSLPSHHRNKLKPPQLNQKTTVTDSNHHNRINHHHKFLKFIPVLYQNSSSNEQNHFKSTRKSKQNVSNSAKVVRIFRRFSVIFCENHHHRTLTFAIQASVRQLQERTPCDHEGFGEREKKRDCVRSEPTKKKKVRNWFIFSFCAITYQKHQEHIQDSRFSEEFRSNLQINSGKYTNPSRLVRNRHRRFWMKD
jgi:hypothetical protein